MHKLGIIVPYRNRYKQLIQFKQHIREYLKDKDIDYKLLIIEQDDGTAFNRGKLLNIGVIRAKELGCDYVVFHDIDMLPIRADYSYSDKPTHLSTKFQISNNLDTMDIPFPQYFGGVTMFTVENFERINGYSNEYWGWGFEDDDLFHRVRQVGLSTDIFKDPSYVASSTSMKFNGVDSYGTLDNIISYVRDFSIHIAIQPDNLLLNHEKVADKYPIFSVPGYDFNLYYDSFKRYNLEIFDRKGQIHTITSDIVEPRPCKLTITWESRARKLSLYIDKEIIGEVTLSYSLYAYSRHKTMYIGCSSREVKEKEKINYYPGGINTFCTYQCCLGKEEIDSLVDNQGLGLSLDFDNYKSSEEIITYYDPKFTRHYTLIDISPKGNDAKVYKCWFESTKAMEYSYVAVPHRRRSLFQLLDHEPNGYLNGRWKDQLTRYNQLKYTNEVLTGIRSFKDDGLSNCDYQLYGEVSVDNVHQLNVGL